MMSGFSRALGFGCALTCLLPGLTWSQEAPPPADLSLSQSIGAKGLQQVAADLAAKPDPSPEDRFALAGLQFLSGVEGALQTRWQTGLEADWSELPILRLPIPSNPEARAFTGADLSELLGRIEADMNAARQTLDALGQSDFALDIALGDLWFDINMNGSREPGEALAEVLGVMMGGQFAEGAQLPVVRFDTADAAWLTAYTHMISGFVGVGRAYDIGGEVDQIYAQTAAMDELAAAAPPSNAWDMMFGKQVDRVSMILRAMGQKPDPAIAREVQAHFLNMVAQNRRFWTLVAAETDNSREWIPNEQQQSALGLPMPEGTAERWLAVLDDAEKLLQGKLLVPHWRYGGAAGINLDKLFADPPALDLIGIIQGGDLLPYAEIGQQASMQSWNDFEALLWGDAVMFAVWLN